MNQSINNPLINTKKIRKLRKNPKSKVISFVPSIEIENFIINFPQEMKGFYKNRSAFINESIQRNLFLINNPKQFLISLKQLMPGLWKYVNRKKFV